MDQSSVLLERLYEEFPPGHLAFGPSVHIVDNTPQLREGIENRRWVSNWQNLMEVDGIEKFCEVTPLTTYGPHSFTYHLPLYLWLALSHSNPAIVIPLLQTLSDTTGDNLVALCMLNSDQRRCVCEILDYFSREAIALDGVLRDMTKTARDEFWSQPIEEGPRPDFMNNDYMRNLIQRAFYGVKLDDGVSLHKTIYLDNYGLVKREVMVQIEQDEKFDWANLVDDPELYRVTGTGGPSFFDDKGLRFHLPAYMMLAQQQPNYDVIDSIIFNLTTIDAYNLGRFEILNKHQRYCVREFLLSQYYTLNNYSDAEYLKMWQAIQGYWDQKI